ncbi:MAG: tetratricopeptide repeat protein [Candidatus Kapaibacterium sp.]
MSKTNELRVFISSTFRDLGEEREHLVKNVFPEIRTLCRTRGIRFTEVDLRWGLTEEDVKLGQVIRACLEEVDKCRPYFIGITGNRYGYVPTTLDIYKDPGLLDEFSWLENAAMDEMSITEMEAYYAMLGNDTGKSPVDGRFYFRDHSTDENDSDAQELLKLTEFQGRIRTSGASVELFADADSLGQMIYHHLVQIVDRDFAEVRPPSLLDEERGRHQAFALSRRHAYIPNHRYLKRLNVQVAGDDPPLVVHAFSGSGKSSLFAFWAEQTRRKQPDLNVIEHYVGIGATANDHLAIVRHFCMEVKERFDRPEEVPSQPEDLEKAFVKWIGYAEHELTKCGQRMILILDGLNQLKGNAAQLRWIPNAIPQSIRMILSTTDAENAATLQDRGWNLFKLNEFSDEEREAVIVRYLAEYRKSLNAAQINQIAGDEKCGHPLFLRTLLEELRLVGRHEDLQDRIDDCLSTNGTEDLFQSVLERMEQDYGVETVEALLPTLWASRSGLDEREMSELSGFSPLKVATVISGLDYHLVRTEGRLSFFHDYLRSAVQDRYLEGDEKRCSLHQKLASFFEQADISPRTSVELLYQLHEANESDRLADRLANIDTFMSVYEGETRYELFAYWAELLPAYNIAEMYRIGFENWRCSDVSQRFTALDRISALAQTLDRLEEARELAELRLNYAQQHENRDEEGFARIDLAYIPLQQGDFDRAFTHLSTAQDIFASTNNLRGQAKAVRYLGGLYYHRGEFDKVLEYAQQAIGLWEKIGDLRAAAGEYGNMGIVFRIRGDLNKALEYTRHQLDTCTDHGDREGMASASLNIGSIFTNMCRYDEAEHYYRQALEIGAKLGRSSMIPLVMGSLAEIHSLRGDYLQAVTDQHLAAELFEKAGDRVNNGSAHANIGEVYAKLHNYSAALEHLNRALTVHTELNHRLNRCKCILAIAELLLAIREEVETFPPYLAQYVEEADRPTWQRALLRISRANAEESLLISKEESSEEIELRAQIALGRIAAAEGDRESARLKLLTVLQSTNPDNQRADAHYWIWNLGLEPEVDHGEKSLSLYNHIYTQTPKHTDHLRIQELTEAIEKVDVRHRNNESQQQ